MRVLGDTAPLDHHMRIWGDDCLGSDRVERNQIYTRLTYISFSHIVRVLINIPGQAKVANLHNIVLR